MKLYITVFLVVFGFGAQPALAEKPAAFCGDTVAADPAPAPAPEPEEEEPDCE